MLHLLNAATLFPFPRSRHYPRKTPKFLAAVPCPDASAGFPFFALLHLFEGYLHFSSLNMQVVIILIFNKIISKKP
jgi:hypothetical protein